MIRNYFKIALRNIYRQKGYSLINFIGLSIGLVTCFFTIMFIQNELSYDTIHSKGENIYRIVTNTKADNTERSIASTFGLLAPLCKDEIPEIISCTRMIRPNRNTTNKITVNYKDNNYYLDHLHHVDPNFFEFFDFKLKYGERSDVLKYPGSVVVTEETAHKIFGDNDPAGEIISYPDLEATRATSVSGILENFPVNSHFSFDLAVSNESLNEQMYRTIFGSFDRTQVYSYILLEDGADPAIVEEKINKVFENHKNSSEFSREADVRLSLQPLLDIHLNSHLEMELASNGSMSNVYAFSSIALMLLLISSINFVNLTTARSLKRAKEIGLRKVAGALKGSLVFQLIGESLVTVMISMILAVILSFLLLPVVNSTLGVNLSLSQFYNVYVILGIILVTIITGIGAGIYPSVFISSLPTTLIIKGNLHTNLQGSKVRETLVIAQFVISITMLICTLVVMNQLDYLRTKELGFNKDQIVCFKVNETESEVESERIKNLIKDHPDVLSVSTSLIVPGQNTPTAHFSLQGANEEDKTLMDFTITDRNFIKTYGMEILEGRGFSELIDNDTSAFVINETAAEMLGGSEKVLNREVTLSHPEFTRSGKVIGVVKDFHFRTLYDEIGPFVITPFPFTSIVSVKFRPSKTKEVINYVQDRFAEINQQSGSTYFFIDEEFGRTYKAAEKLGVTFSLFAFMTILISSIGLIGLTSYTAGRRKKEIGIRKVLGSSVSGVFYNLSKGFIRSILVANIIAFPAAYFIMEQWLRDFAYRADFNPGIYLLAAITTACFSLIAVGLQTYKAASANPIDSIKYE